MRISDRILAQKVTDNEVVIIDESSMEEVIISEEEARRLAAAFTYFFPNAAIPETVAPLTAESP